MANVGYVKTLPLCFVDTETGGLDSHENALLSVAAIRCDPFSLDVQERLELKVRPWPGLTIHPQAAAVNGYTPAKWLDAVTEGFALDELKKLIDGSVWIGHTPAFDQRFLDAAFERNKRSYKPGWRYLIDTAVLAWPLLQAGRIPDLKLQTIAKELAIDPGEAHSALADANTCLQIYKNLTKRYLSVVKAVKGSA